MKKIFLLLSIFVLSKVGYSQFPVIQYIGSDSTIVKSRGGLQGRFAPIPFTDTTSANLSRISQYPGALIYTSGVDKYWYRNATSTGWIEFTSSGGSTVNIYNSNGTLTGERTVDGDGNGLQFNSFRWFAVGADSVQIALNAGVFRVTGMTSTQDTSTYKPIVVDPITGRVLQSSYWYGSGDSSIFATVYRTDTLAQNIRDEIAALPTPTIQQTIDEANTVIDNHIQFGAIRGNTGYILNDSFNRYGLGPVYDSSISNVVITYNGLYLKDSVKAVGEGSLNNYITVNAPTGRSKWTQEVKFVAKRRNTQDYGLGVGLRSTNSFFSPDFFMHFVVRNNVGQNGSMQLYLDGQTPGYPQFVTVDTVSTAINDTLIATISYEDGLITATYQNTNTGQFIDTSYNFGTSVAGSKQAPNTAKFIIRFFGGVHEIFYWRISSDEKKGSVLFRGNSITYGYTASVLDSTYPAQIFNNRYLYEKNGGPGDRSTDAVTNLEEIKSLRPQYFVLSIGVNDAQSGVSGAVYSSNIMRVIDSAQSVGSTVILLSNTPLNSTSVVPYNDTLQAIATRYGLKYINTYDSLNGGGTSWDASYTTDNVHPNTLGHTVIARIIAREAPEIIGDTAIRVNRPLYIPSPTHFIGWDNNTGTTGAVDIPAYPVLFGKNSTLDSIILTLSDGTRYAAKDSIGTGGGGSGTVTSVGTGYGLSGGTITTTGTILVDSSSLSNYYLRRKDSLTASNLLGYVTRTVLADSAAAIRSAIGGGSDTSVFIVDTLYNRLAHVINTDSLRLKSLQMQVNGSTVTPTETDSTLSYNIIDNSIDTTIYNSDGVISSDRAINGDSKSISFNTFRKFYAETDSLQIYLNSGYINISGINDGGTLSDSILVVSVDGDVKKMSSDRVGTPTMQQVLDAEGGNAILTGNPDFGPIEDLNTELSFGDTYLWNRISMYSGSYRFLANDLNHQTDIIIHADSIALNPSNGYMNIDSLRQGTSNDSVLVWNKQTGIVGYRNASSFGGGGSGGVSDTSVFIVDTLYNRLAHTINVDSLRLKSLRMQLNGSTITPTTTDSTLSFNISTLDTTTVPLITFSAGAGFAADTAMVTDSSLFGSLFTGQYEYTIKEVQAVIKGNAGDSIVLKIVYNDSFNVDGTKVNGAGLSLNNRYTGNNFSITTNRTVPVNSWFWMKPEAVITGKKPKYISVTLLGYKTYVAP